MSQQQQNEVQVDASLVIAELRTQVSELSMSLALARAQVTQLRAAQVDAKAGD